MELLLTIRDSDFGFSFHEPDHYESRTAARAVIFDRDDKIALLHVRKKGYHKLPGGGVDEGESIEEGLQRELREEIGCTAKNIREIGMTEEFRYKYSVHQTSYCFVADVDGEKGESHMEEDEIADGFEVVWMDIKDAVTTLESELAIDNYEGIFIVHRELAFLKVALSKK